jgi:hypothetical protein
MTGAPVTETLVACDATDIPDSNKLTFNLGRIVAKVGFDEEFGSEITVDGDAIVIAGGKLSDLEFKVHNNPKHYYVNAKEVGAIYYTPYYDGTFTGAAYLDGENFIGIDEDVAYMMENTNQTPTESTATYLLIKATFTPTVVYAPDDLDAAVDDFEGGDDFFRVAYKDVAGKAIGFAPVYYNADPEAAGVLDYWLTDDDAPAEATSAVAVKYTDGACYYALPIKNKATGFYDVLRNKHYNVKLNSIGGIGEPVATNVETGASLNEVRQSAIQATINVLPWALVEVDGEL